LSHTFAVLSLWIHQVLDFVTDFLVFTLFKLYVSGNLLKTWKTLVSNISVDNGKYSDICFDGKFVFKLATLRIMFLIRSQSNIYISNFEPALHLHILCTLIARTSILMQVRYLPMPNGGLLGDMKD
jgi:hypothetical protein